MEAYELGELLGQGTYGTVFRGLCKATGAIVAVKKTKYDASSEGVPSNTLREVSLLKNLKHPNIVKLLDIVCSERSIYMIFECLDQDLKRFITENGPLDEFKTRSFMYQLLNGISFCHTNRIVHRDIKPQNILLSTDGTIKIADFGLARTYNVPVKRYTQEVVTLWYRPPELLMNSYFYSTSIDIWSLGCIFSEMNRGAPLFSGNSEIDQLFKIFQVTGTPDETTWPDVSELKYFNKEFPKFKPQDLAELHPTLGVVGNHLLREMLILFPCQRVSAKSAVEHAYFNIFNSIR